MESSEKSVTFEIEDEFLAKKYKKFKDFSDKSCIVKKNKKQGSAKKRLSIRKKRLEKQKLKLKLNEDYDI
jgi:hypothetical protein